MVEDVVVGKVDCESGTWFTLDSYFCPTTSCNPLSGHLQIDLDFTAPLGLATQVGTRDLSGPLPVLQPFTLSLPICSRAWPWPRPPRHRSHLPLALRALLLPSPALPSRSGRSPRALWTFPNSRVQMNLSHLCFQSTLLLLLSSVCSPYAKLSVGKAFGNCIRPKCKALFLPYNLSPSPLLHLPPSTYQIVGAQ